jgi:hypothetical protein
MNTINLRAFIRLNMYQPNSGLVHLDISLELLLDSIKHKTYGPNSGLVATIALEFPPSGEMR